MSVLAVITPGSLINDGRYAAAQLQEKRNQIVMEHLPLVKAIAVRIHETLPVHVDLDDLVNTGVLGLMDAAKKFDPEKMVVFSSYAKHRIRGAILDSLRQQDWASRDMRRQAKLAESASRDLTAELHRNPTEHEVAARLGIDIERLRLIRTEVRSGTPISTTGRGNDQEEAPVPELPARVESQPDNIFAHDQLRDKLQQAIHTLPPRYQRVVLLYYTSEMTMKEIGKMLGINESRVSQIHKSALSKMGVALQTKGIESPTAFAV
jgi:RNA polymerase sigma factor FliA